MISLARFITENCGRMLPQNAASSAFCAMADLRRFRVRQAPTCDRSGGEAGAVRDRPAFAPWPVADLVVGCAAAPIAPVPLTPARWGAIKLAASFPPWCGSGGSVPQGTGTEPRGNRQSLEIAGFSDRFPRFRPSYAREARARACAATRAYAHVRSGGTTEPHQLTYIYQYVSSSLAVPSWFPAEPAADLDRQRHFLAGGYARRGSAGLGGVGQVVAKGVEQGRAAQNFGVFGLGLVGGLDVEQLRGNGGILPISACLGGRVGRTMLEGSAQRRGLLRFLHPRRKPSRVRGEGPGGSDRAGHPPVPPAPTRTLPSSLARHAGGILDRLSTAKHFRAGVGTAPRFSFGIGSGLGRDLCQRDKRAVGRGVDGAGWGLRRSQDASAGVAHVNAC